MSAFRKNLSAARIAGRKRHVTQGRVSCHRLEQRTLLSATLVETGTQTFGPDFLDIVNESLSPAVAQFDDQGGYRVLDSVELTAGSSITSSVSGSIHNLSSTQSAQYYASVIDATTSISGPGVGVVANSTPVLLNYGPITVAPATTFTIPLHTQTLSASGHAVLTGAAVLPFVGSGSIAPFVTNASADVDAGFSGSTNLTKNVMFETTGGATATVVYRYHEITPAITIKKLTNGSDNDTGGGPYLLQGSAVTWTYLVSNPGDVALKDVGVTDDAGTPSDPLDDFSASPVLAGTHNVGDLNGDDLLQPGEKWTFTAVGTVAAGQYVNLGTATGIPANADKSTIPLPAGVTNPTDGNPDRYFGYTSNIAIQKLTNGSDNDAAPGIYVPAGSAVTWTYNVTTTGNVPLSAVAVTDNVPGVNPAPSLSGGFNVGDADQDNLLDAGETWVYTANGVAVAGQYTNTGTAVGTPSTAKGVVIAGAPQQTASDPDNYFGYTTGVALVKTTNGTNNDSGPGVLVPVGSTITWTYTVTNTGNVSLANVVITDDNGTPGNTGDDFTVGTIASLAPGATKTLTATGIAQAGQYTNIGTAVGTPVDASGNPIAKAPPQTASNPDSYTAYQLSTIDGVVFCDDNLNGVLNSGEELEDGAQVTLKNSVGQIVGSPTTGSNGAYSFTGLQPGTYTLLFTSPSSGHQAEQSHGAVVITTTRTITLAAGQNSTGNNFAEIATGSVSGYVYSDADDDGLKESGEPGIGSVTITLTGRDYLGNLVNKTVTTGSDGKYIFANIAPSDPSGYTITETQPSGYTDGDETLGTVGGVTVGVVVNGSSCGTITKSAFAGVVLPGCENTAVNYNFGELGIFHGLTATIGFWHNKNGQALINSFGKTSNGLTLANWLATTFPNLYGSKAPALTTSSTKGANLTGKTNQQVAAYFNQLFGVSGQKAYAQVLATAFGVFTTTNSLNTSSAARSLALQHGFVLSNTGAGAATYFVPSANWSAFGITSASGATKTIAQLLVAANSKAVAGVLCNGNTTQITQTNNVFDAINNNGDIGFGMALMGTSAEDLAEGSEALPGDLLFGGTYLVSIDLAGAVDPTNARARILDAMVQLNANLASYGIVLSELPSGIDAAPDITIHFADTTSIGGVAQGVLGVSEAGGQVTLVNGWNYYFGSSAAGIGSNQYDFETIAMHELGHAIGLGHSGSKSSAMYAYLPSGTTRRQVTFSDLAIEDPTPSETTPDAMYAVKRRGHATNAVAPKQGYAFVPGNAPLTWASAKKRSDETTAGLLHDVVDR